MSTKIWIEFLQDAVKKYGMMTVIFVLTTALGFYLLWNNMDTRIRDLSAENKTLQAQLTGCKSSEISSKIWEGEYQNCKRQLELCIQNSLYSKAK